MNDHKFGINQPIDIIGFAKLKFELNQVIEITEFGWAQFRAQQLFHGLNQVFKKSKPHVSTQHHHFLHQTQTQ